MRRLAGVALVLGAIVVPSLSARAQAPTAAVEIHDNYYSPVPVTVHLGDSVTWTNKGSSEHSVTQDGGFDSTPAGTSCPPSLVLNDGCLAPGSSFTVTFNSTGTFSYHCRVHGDAMVGSVVVQSPSPTTSTTTTSTSSSTTTSTSSTTTSLPASEQPTITQAALPSIPSSSQLAVPKSIKRSTPSDDSRPWALVAVGIAGSTAIAGIVLVRRGRVPLG
jgi:plastocyanin